MAVIRKLFMSKGRVTFAVIDGGMAVEFSMGVNWDDRESSYGGVEFHKPPEGDELPDHQNCWLLEGPCVHDGSSLYAFETFIPRFWTCAEIGDYKSIWGELERALFRQRSQ